VDQEQTLHQEDTHIILKIAALIFLRHEVRLHKGQQPKVIANPSQSGFRNNLQMHEVARGGLADAEVTRLMPVVKLSILELSNLRRDDHLLTHQRFFQLITKCLSLIRGDLRHLIRSH
jgi:hypothetical protein